MADDRMYLRNKITNTRVCIAKHLSSGWYTPNGDVDKRLNGIFSDNITEFFEDPHAYEIVFEVDCKTPQGLSPYCKCTHNGNT